MAKPKKKIRKAAPKSRKVAPQAIKRKKVKAAKRPVPRKSAKPMRRRVAEVVSAATRATVDFESAAGRIERAAVRKVGEVAGRATRALRSAMSQAPKIPSYDELPVRAGAPAGAAWGVFGDDDNVGTINLLTPERVAAATSSIPTGQAFALTLPINLPDPPPF